MKVVIISHFTGSFSATDNDRFLYIAKSLCKQNEVEIITSSFMHSSKSQRKKTVVKWPFKVTFLNEPGYKKNVCIKRFYSHFIWGINVKKYLASYDERIDVIYCAVPSLTGPYFAARYCKKNGIRFLIDIQDLWPEAFKMVFNMKYISDIIFYPFKIYANKIYKQADSICAVSQSYVKRGLKVNCKNKEGHAVFLGTDLYLFDLNTSIPIGLSKDKGILWLVYCGTLGASYDIPLVVDALKLVQNRGIIAPMFVVLGDGPQENYFKSYAEKANIDCIFLGRLPYEQMCSFLSKGDITINPITANSAASIINKHGDYAASGLPVINTQESLEYRGLIEEYGMGINCKSGDVFEVAEAIIFLVNNPDVRKRMGEASRLCAEEKFDRQRSYQELFDVIEGK